MRCWAVACEWWVMRPSKMVATTRPRNSMPRNGEFWALEWKLVGVQVASGSKITRLAAAPSATCWPWCSNPPMRAGLIDIRAKKSPASMPVAVLTAAAAVSSPITPRGASSKVTSVSKAAWGA